MRLESSGQYHNTQRDVVIHDSLLCAHEVFSNLSILPHRFQSPIALETVGLAEFAVCCSKVQDPAKLEHHLLSDYA